LSAQKLWYVRHGANVSGPHPGGLIANYVLLGRIAHSDEVSLDGNVWWTLGEVAELLPLNRLIDTPAADYEKKKWREERYRAALRWADERHTLERRHAGAAEEKAEVETAQPRTRVDRRVRESPDILALRQLAEAGELLRRRSRERFYGVAAVLVVLAIAGVAAAVLLGPAKPVKVGLGSPAPACTLPAAPQVNWSGCDKSGAWLRGADLKNADLGWARLNSAQLGGSNLAYTRFEGADLSYADLSRAQLFGANLSHADLSSADLSGADLSYADLRGARLAAATLTGARLDNAVWPDGRRCDQGSVGRCL
jgi:hypothetical protein